MSCFTVRDYTFFEKHTKLKNIEEEKCAKILFANALFKQFKLNTSSGSSQ